MLTGRIHSFETFGAVDGPGIRFVVFFQGCPLRCKFCHNPDTWNSSLGTEMTADEIVSKALPYRPFYQGGGVTLSGGEPLAQPDFALKLLKKLKASGFHTAIDTSGAVPLRSCRAAVDAADLLLLDFKASTPDLAAEITGSADILSREMELLEHCEAQGKPVWLRHVIIPNLTADEKALNLLAQQLQPFKCIEKIELLPFHKLGEHKWSDGAYTLSATPAPGEDIMAHAREIFSSKGFNLT